MGADQHLDALFEVADGKVRSSRLQCLPLVEERLALLVNDPIEVGVVLRELEVLEFLGTWEDALVHLVLALLRPSL